MIMQLPQLLANVLPKFDVECLNFGIYLIPVLLLG